MSDQNVDSLRKSLISQVDSSSLDSSSKDQLKEKINSSSHEELLSLINQGSHGGSDGSGDNGSSNCIFCSIFSGTVDSYKVLSDEHSLAVLEINPLSKGHVIIIPKVHGKLSIIPENVNSMIKLVTSKIQSVLDPEKVEISKAEIMGHTIINAIPLYSSEKLSKRSADSKELEDLVKKFSSEVIKTDVKKEVIVIPQKTNRKVKGKPAKPSPEDIVPLTPITTERRGDDKPAIEVKKAGDVVVKPKSDKAKSVRYKAPSRVP
ncbi:MAG: HIT domain-containing protein [Nanoarchaeota archaeon]